MATKNLKRGNILSALILTKPRKSCDMNKTIIPRLDLTKEREFTRSLALSYNFDSHRALSNTKPSQMKAGFMTMPDRNSIKGGKTQKPTVLECTPLDSSLSCLENADSLFKHFKHAKTFVEKNAENQDSDHS